MNAQKIGRPIPVALALATLAMLSVACGQTSPVAATHGQSSSAAPSASAAPSPSPSPSPSPAYAGRLTFNGGVTGTFDVRAPASSASNACGAGSVDVAVEIHGQEWDLNASASPFHGPAGYSVGTGFTLLISTATYDIWTATSGTALYSTDRSATVDVAITNMMAGPGEAGATAHIRGTISCG